MHRRRIYRRIASPSWWGKKHKAPSSLIVSTISDTRIDLSWDSRGDVERSVDNIDYTIIAVNQGGVYSDTEATIGVNYYYRIHNVSGYSDVVRAEALSWVIPITGQTSGTATAGTMVISTTEDITITSTGDVSVGVVQAADSTFRSHTVTVNCPNNGSGTIVIPDSSKVVSLGNYDKSASINFYTGIDTTAPILTLNLNNVSSLVQKITQYIGYATILPITGNTAFPVGLTYLYINGQNITWTYTGTLPTGLTFLNLLSNNINWTYNGALPTGITGTIYLNGDNIRWTHTGALPTGTTALYLIGANIVWTYSGTLPTNLTSTLRLNGALLNWTGLSIPAGGNYIEFNLANYRITKMSSTDMVTLLTNLTNRVGTLPATITINDYADYAAPPVEVTNAVTTLKAAKSITTVNLGA